MFKLSRGAQTVVGLTVLLPISVHFVSIVTACRESCSGIERILLWVDPLVAIAWLCVVFLLLPRMFLFKDHIEVGDHGLPELPRADLDRLIEQASRLSVDQLVNVGKRYARFRSTPLRGLAFSVAYRTATNPARPGNLPAIPNVLQEALRNKLEQAPNRSDVLAGLVCGAWATLMRPYLKADKFELLYSPLEPDL